MYCILPANWNTLCFLFQYLCATKCTCPINIVFYQKLIFYTHMLPKLCGNHIHVKAQSHFTSRWPPFFLQLDKLTRIIYASYAILVKKTILITWKLVWQPPLFYWPSPIFKRNENLGNFMIHIYHLTLWWVSKRKVKIHKPRW
jgi:hypothetical protein